MKKLLLLAVVLSLSALAFAGDWSNVVLIDSHCVRTEKNPDMHTRACAMRCSDSGYGIVTSEGKFLKFDQAGNEKALALLDSTDKNDHLRVNVKGELKGDTIEVHSVSW